ncbi:MAG: hypothetical protein KJ936_06025, partial [Proteobacteria bacterium]|nr:hypothetical protein [Pseudomonadota bacterium]
MRSNIGLNKDAREDRRAPVSPADGADATRRAIALRITIRFLSRRFAPVHQANAAVSRSREQARVYVSR